MSDAKDKDWDFLSMAIPEFLEKLDGYKEQLSLSDNVTNKFKGMFKWLAESNIYVVQLLAFSEEQCRSLRGFGDTSFNALNSIFYLHGFTVGEFEEHAENLNVKFIKQEYGIHKSIRTSSTVAPVKNDAFLLNFVLRQQEIDTGRASEKAQEVELNVRFKLKVPGGESLTDDFMAQIDPEQFKLFLEIAFRRSTGRVPTSVDYSCSDLTL